MVFVRGLPIYCIAICERLLTEWSDTYVILGSRDVKRGEEAVNELIQSIGDGKNNIQDRIESFVLDTSSDESVREAAKAFQSKHGSTEGSLYGIINNAGVRLLFSFSLFLAEVVLFADLISFVKQIGFGYKVEENINVNYFGPRRVNDAFSPFLQRIGGRIVHVSSASGPRYVEDVPITSPMKQLLAKPWTIPGGIAEVDEIARNPSKFLPKDGDPYGASKALLNAYTVIHAKIEKDLIINAVTPGFIATDLTAAYGATNPPSKGAIPPCYLMMDDAFIPNTPSGRYYGSDCIRSPLSSYRGPGDPPFEDDEDLANLLPTATAMVSIL